ncbi:MAG: ABC transporter permease [Chloroflexi bacterium]|nr:ABC transporter permease [Chloroflexota bacterium]
MLRYILLRIAAAIPVLLGSSLVLFTLLRLIPGDPTHAILMAMADPAADLAQLEKDRAALSEELGLNWPFVVQYVSWLSDILRGNLGVSLRSRAPVTGELMLRLPATLQLAGASLLVMVLIALPTGILGGIYHGRPLDRLTRLVALLGVSMPSFILALLLMYGFSVPLGWLPTFGRVTPAHLVLPSITLGMGIAAGASRLLRAGLLEALSQPYIITAEAKGLPRRTIVLKHALRNALLPVVTSSSLLVGGLLGGSVIVETVFAWPGIGRYIVDAIAGRDYPVIQAFTLTMAVVYVFVNLIVDILYRFIDPRVRVEGSQG